MASPLGYTPARASPPPHIVRSLERRLGLTAVLAISMSAMLGSGLSAVSKLVASSTLLPDLREATPSHQVRLAVRRALQAN